MWRPVFAFMHIPGRPRGSPLRPASNSCAGPGTGCRGRPCGVPFSHSRTSPGDHEGRPYDPLRIHARAQERGVGDALVASRFRIHAHPRATTRVAPTTRFEFMRGPRNGRVGDALVASRFRIHAHPRATTRVAPTTRFEFMRGPRNGRGRGRPCGVPFSHSCTSPGDHEGRPYDPLRIHARAQERGVGDALVASRSRIQAHPRATTRVAPTTRFEFMHGPRNGRVGDALVASRFRIHAHPRATTRVAPTTRFEFMRGPRNGRGRGRPCGVPFSHSRTSPGDHEGRPYDPLRVHARAQERACRGRPCGVPFSHSCTSPGDHEGRPYDPASNSCKGPGTGCRGRPCGVPFSHSCTSPGDRNGRPAGQPVYRNPLAIPAMVARNACATCSSSPSRRRASNSACSRCSGSR